MNKHQPELTSPWAMLAALLIGTIIGTMGNSMVSIAIPSLMDHFSISLTSAVWSITIYTLTFSVLIPVFGILSLAIGYKKLFISGMILVCISSIICALSRNFIIFLIARVGIGIGVATILPTIMGTIANQFPVEIQGKATGYWALVNSLGHAFGPTLGGILINYFSWQAIFWINLPLGILSIFVAYKVFPCDRTTPIQSFDWPGASGIVIFVFSSLLGISQIAKFGITNLSSILLAILIGISVVFIIIYENKRTNPFVDFKLFSNSRYLSAVVPIAMQAFCQFGLLVSLPIFLIDIQQIEKQFAGIVIMSMTLMMAIASPIAGRLTDHWSSKWACFIGVCLVGLGSVFFLIFQFENFTLNQWITFIINLIILGTGFGLIQSASTVAVIHASPKNKVGEGTGFFHMIRFICASLGSTIFGIFLETSQSNQTNGFYLGFWITILLVLFTIPFTLRIYSPSAQKRSTQMAAKKNLV